MSKKNIYSLVFTLLTITGISQASDTKSASDKSSEMLTPLGPDGTLKWLSWEEAVKLNEKNPRKIFIDFYTEWCGWCKVMDNKTFQDPYIAKYMSKNFYCVKFDAERTDSIRFQNFTFRWVPGGRNGYHQLAAYFMQNELSYPTFTVLTPKFELITPIKGYIAKEQFEPMITFFGEDRWLNQENIEVYKTNYVRPVE
jgi:thioredoxin-related protein